MTYIEKLKHPKWQKKRLEILERDKFTCQLCKDEKTTLHIHHKKYTTNEIWDEINENLITLCEHCHVEVELIKKANIDFKDISICKLSPKEDPRRIMFISIWGYLRMLVYQKETLIASYGFKKGLEPIKKIITQTIKDGKKDGNINRVPLI